eukprot:365063-Chlamydomonas_euryale.AAC.5
MQLHDEPKGSCCCWTLLTRWVVVAAAAMAGELLCRYCISVPALAIAAQCDAMPADFRCIRAGWGWQPLVQTHSAEVFARPRQVG